MEAKTISGLVLLTALIIFFSCSQQQQVRQKTIEIHLPPTAANEMNLLYSPMKFLSPSAYQIYKQIGKLNTYQEKWDKFLEFWSREENLLEVKMSLEDYVQRVTYAANYFNDDRSIVFIRFGYPSEPIIKISPYDRSSLVDGPVIRSQEHYEVWHYFGLQLEPKERFYVFIRNGSTYYLLRNTRKIKRVGIITRYFFDARYDPRVRTQLDN